MMENGINMAIEPRDLLTGAEWLVAGGTLMTALVLSVKKMYRTARNVEDALTMVNKIQKQFEPNGGNSLHDRLGILDEKIDNNGRIAQEAAEAIGDIHKRLGRLEAAAMNRSARNDDGSRS